MRYSILDQVFGPVLVLNQKLEIIYYNHQFTIFSKLAPRILNLQPLLFEVFLETQDLKKLITESIVSNMTVVSHELSLALCKNSEINYTAVIKLIPQEQNEYILCFNDLSVENRLFEKYKMQMEELKNAHSQIIQADKLNTLVDLTAGITHEISNPLTIAHGSVDLIRALLDETELSKVRNELRQEAVDLEASLERIDIIMNNMKNYLHQGNNLEYVNLKELLQETISLVQSLFKKSEVNTRIDCDEQNIILYLNRVSLEQVLINLLKNAFQELIAFNSNERKIIIRVLKNGQSINVDITDNGRGIEEGLEEKIFDPFFTTKKIGDGTGLGLAISKKIISTMNGDLTLHQTSESGSIFRITLPSLNTTLFSLLHAKHQELPLIVAISDSTKILNSIIYSQTLCAYKLIGITSWTESSELLEDCTIRAFFTDNKNFISRVNTPVFTLPDGVDLLGPSELNSFIEVSLTKTLEQS